MQEENQYGALISVLPFQQSIHAPRTNSVELHLKDPTTQTWDHLQP